MKRMKYSNSIDCITPDDYFTPTEKKLFLQIPHQSISTNGKIETMDFNVPENGEYSNVRRIELVEVKEKLTDEEMDQQKIRLLVHNTSYSMTEKPGLYIKAHHGTQTFALMQELYKHDEINARKLLEEYYEVSLGAMEITTIANRLVKDTDVMVDYLHKENIVVKNYHIDYDSYFKLENEDQQDDFIKKLNKTHGKGYKFKAYNDLDYTPVIVDGDYHIYDSASACLFVVKEEDNIKKIYKVHADFVDLITDNDDAMNEFAFTHYQRNILLSEAMTEKDLIGEIKNGVLTKATVELTHFDLLQADIVEELRNKKKIIYDIPDLSFEDLLKNFTLQKEYYHIEERAILDLLKELIIENGFVTYKDFSLMDLTKEVKHEEIGNHTVRDLIPKSQEPRTDGRITMDLDDETKLSHLKKLHQEYKDQINIYLEKLLEKYDNEYTQVLCNYIEEEGKLKKVSSKKIK